jgi:hypothetical protein
MVLPFLNFVILHSLFSNEATAYPYSLTPLGLVGLNDEKKAATRKDWTDPVDR